MSGAALRQQLARLHPVRIKRQYNKTRHILHNQVRSPIIYVPESAIPSVAQQPVNCEHVVPISISFHYRQTFKSDLHNIFPCLQEMNAARANRKFDDLPSKKEDFATLRQNRYEGCKGLKNNAAVFDPPASKGAIARACAYFFTQYPQFLQFMEEVIDRETMLRWHRSFPVDDGERARNHAIKLVQGNINPFVSHPSLVEQAFADSDSIDELETQESGKGWYSYREAQAEQTETAYYAWVPRYHCQPYPAHIQTSLFKVSPGLFPF